MNVTKRIQAFYGAKYLPFGQDVPDEGLHMPARVENFAQRVLANINEGGYALCTGGICLAASHCVGPFLGADAESSFHRSSQRSSLVT